MQRKRTESGDDRRGIRLREVSIKWRKRLRMEVCTFDHSTPEAEAGGSSQV